MRKTLSLAAFVLAVGSCGLPPGLIVDQELYNEAVRHLPPNYDGISFDDEATKTSWFLTGDYSGLSLREFEEFYQGFAERDGWEIDIFDRDYIDLSKGRAVLGVTYQQSGGSSMVFVFYEVYKWTREEFEANIAESADPKARAFADEVVKTYLALDSYKDQGTQRVRMRDSSDERANFRTAYRKPSDMYFGYRSRGDEFHESWSAFSADSKDVRIIASYDGEQREDDIETAIASLYGVTSGVSGYVPELLAAGENATLFDLVELHILGEETLDDGTKCVVLRGQDFLDDRNTIWIGKEDHLIRKIETREDDRNYDIAIYYPIANADISDDDLRPREPVFD